MSRDASGGRFTPEALARRLDHRFQDPALLEAALVHGSLAGEQPDLASNERLEFLGDAVIDLVVAQLLYAAHPDWDEGALTRARAGLVNKQSLATLARELELGPCLRLGRTERKSGGAEKDTILADAFEAVVAALYLDGGVAPVARLAQRLLRGSLDSDPTSDPKTRFQEWAHAQLRDTPRYRTVGDSGAEEDDSRFQVEVCVAGAVHGKGEGRSKPIAEREAARDALTRLERADA